MILATVRHNENIALEGDALFKMVKQDCELFLNDDS